MVFSSRWGMKGEISITRQFELFQSLAFAISHITLANLVFLTSAARCFFFISSCLSVVGSIESLITPSKSLVMLLSQHEVWASAVLELRCPIRAHASPVPCKAVARAQHRTSLGIFFSLKNLTSSGLLCPSCCPVLHHLSVVCDFNCQRYTDV